MPNDSFDDQRVTAATFLFEVDGVEIGRFMEVERARGDRRRRGDRGGRREQLRAQAAGPDDVAEHHAEARHHPERHAADLAQQVVRRAVRAPTATSSTRSTAAITLIGPAAQRLRAWEFDGAFPVKWKGPDFAVELERHGDRGAGDHAPWVPSQDPRLTPRSAAFGDGAGRGASGRRQRSGRARRRTPGGRLRGAAGGAVRAGRSGCRACGRWQLERDRRRRRRPPLGAAADRLLAVAATRRDEAAPAAAGGVVEGDPKLAALARLVVRPSAPGGPRPSPPRRPRRGLPIVATRRGTTTAGPRTSPGAIVAGLRATLDATPPAEPAVRRRERRSDPGGRAGAGEPPADVLPPDLAALRGRARPNRPGAAAAQSASRGSDAPGRPEPPAWWTAHGVDQRAESSPVDPARGPAAWLDHGERWRRRIKDVAHVGVDRGDGTRGGSEPRHPPSVRASRTLAAAVADPLGAERSSDQSTSGEPRRERRHRATAQRTMLPARLTRASPTLRTNRSPDLHIGAVDRRPCRRTGRDPRRAGASRTDSSRRTAPRRAIPDRAHRRGPPDSRAPPADRAPAERRHHPPPPRHRPTVPASHRDDRPAPTAARCTARTHRPANPPGDRHPRRRPSRAPATSDHPSTERAAAANRATHTAVISASPTTTDRGLDANRRIATTTDTHRRRRHRRAHRPAEPPGDRHPRRRPSGAPRHVRPPDTDRQRHRPTVRPHSHRHLPPPPRHRPPPDATDASPTTDTRRADPATGEPPSGNHPPTDRAEPPDTATIAPTTGNRRGPAHHGRPTTHVAEPRDAPRPVRPLDTPATPAANRATTQHRHLRLPHAPRRHPANSTPTAHPTRRPHRVAGPVVRRAVGPVDTAPTSDSGQPCDHTARRRMAPAPHPDAADREPCDRPTHRIDATTDARVAGPVVRRAVSRPARHRAGGSGQTVRPHNVGHLTPPPRRLDRVPRPPPRLARGDRPRRRPGGAPRSLRPADTSERPAVRPHSVAISRRRRPCARSRPAHRRGAARRPAVVGPSRAPRRGRTRRRASGRGQPCDHTASSSSRPPPRSSTPTTDGELDPARSQRESSG